MKRIQIISLIVLSIFLLTGCSFFKSKMKSLEEDLIGVHFNIGFYDNQGESILDLDGDKVSVKTNYIKSTTVDSDGDKSTNYENSSVITITVDGHNIEQTGNTVIFAEEGLEPLLNFNLPEKIQESGQGGDGYIAIIDRYINRYKNYFGTPKIVVIMSQLGDPIVAYGGNNVYWEIPDNLPKTTKLMIDGKALYIHRANYILFDTELLK